MQVFLVIVFSTLLIGAPDPGEGVVPDSAVTDSVVAVLDSGDKREWLEGKSELSRKKADSLTSQFVVGEEIVQMALESIKRLLIKELEAAGIDTIIAPDSVEVVVGQQHEASSGHRD